MIKLEQKIIINADIQKVLFFISDLSKSLIFDHYYTKIELPSNYSINNQCEFNVHAKYFYSKYKLKAKIKEVTPLKFIKKTIESSDIYLFQINLVLYKDYK